MQCISWIWLGMIIGVSFIAAPAKFMAESLTLPVALEVGRVTFQLFDRLEWLWTAVLLVIAWRRLKTGRLDRISQGLVAAVVAIVVVQSAIFLPALDARVGLVMAGEDLPPSHLHLISGVAEVLQAAALLWLGFRTPARVRRTFTTGC